MREFTGGCNCSVGRILQLRVIVCGTSHTCFALKSRNCHILVMYVQIRDLLIGPNAHAADSCNVFLDQGSGVSGAGISLEGTVPDQALIVKHVEEFSGFAERFIQSGKGNLAVDQTQMVCVFVTAAVRVCTAERSCEAVEHIVGTEGIVCAEPGGHRNFVVLSVAVQVAAVTEGFQAFHPLIDCGRNFQAQLVQPGFVDDQRTRGQNQAFHLLNVRESVGMAVGSGNLLAVLRIVVQNLFQIRHVLVDNVLSRQEDILICVLYNRIAGFSIAKGPENIRKICAGNQLQVNLLRCTLGRNLRPLELNTGILCPFLYHRRVRHVDRTVRASKGLNRDLSVFLLKGFFVLNNRKRSVQCDQSLVQSFLLLGRKLCRSAVAAFLTSAAARGKRRGCHYGAQQHCNPFSLHSLYLLFYHLIILINIINIKYQTLYYPLTAPMVTPFAKYF